MGGFRAYLLAACCGLTCVLVIESCDQPRSCTELGCSDGVSIELGLGAGVLAGVYEVELQYDGRDVTCSLEVAPSYPPGGGAYSQCADGVQLLVTRPGPGGGCAGSDCVTFDASADAFMSVAITATPSHVDVTVTRDGAQLGVASVEPQYREEYPNGPECGGACVVASERVEIH